MIYSVGCDIDKQNIHVCLLSYDLSHQTHQVLSRKSFRNNGSGSKAFIKWVRRSVSDDSAAVRCTMEATGVYHEQLAIYVFDHHQDIRVSVVLPSASKKYITSRGLRSKTDKVDAYGLALMGSERKLPKWKGIDRYWRELRQLTRTRAALQEQITQLSSQLHAQTHSGLRVEVAEQSLQASLTVLREQRDRLTRQITVHLNSRKEMARQLACLDSIPGIGMLTIAVILAETNGFEYFRSCSQLMSFSGYDVVANDSGQRVGKRKISKQGSSHIRRAMYMPASTIVRRKPPVLYDYYNRLLSRHAIKMKAHVALQKKLLGYMYYLWNSQQLYNPDTYEQTQKRLQKKIAPLKGEATVDTPHAFA